MAKVVYDLNRSSLNAKKIVVYTILRVDNDSVKPAYNRFYKTRTEARNKVWSLNSVLTKKKYRVAKTVLVHA